MEIKKKVEGNKLTITLSGRLDTSTAPQLEKELKEWVEGVTELIFDFTALDYISSAGLRFLLSDQKIMNKQGTMIIRNVNETIMEIFDVTGFVDLLTIECFCRCNLGSSGSWKRGQEQTQQSVFNRDSICGCTWWFVYHFGPDICTADCFIARSQRCTFEAKLP